MDTKLPIKSINEELPIMGIPGVAAIGVVVAGGMLVIAGVGLGWFGDLGAGAIMATAIAAAIYIVGIFLNRKEKQKKAYAEKLSTIPLGTLLKLESSPELDDESRSVIRELLNEKHPGWSLL